MADPVTLGAIGIGGSVLGGITKAFSGFMGGQASGAAYKYQAGIAQMNKNIDEQNAEYAEKMGEVKAEQVGMRDAERIAQTKAIQGASGLNLNFGSALDVRASEQVVAQQDQAITRANADRQAYGERVKAANASAQSSVYKMAGSQAETAGTIDALGSLLGTASSVSSKWLEGDRLGMWGSGGGSNAGGTGSDASEVA